MVYMSFLKIPPETPPCPFCGSKDLFGHLYLGDNDEYRIECRECGAFGPADDNFPLALEVWSDRK